ncbi:hypothetical protein GCM10007359_13500 [Rothia aerolata]|uniref:GtrA/DPMS transmembrane domain-containing protein n=1 Tax=Rothia aerolata TaxID=1812262 RepID=A0A917IVC0_9MICC|nr:hypothetical protein GCM10007359_13500 [Rothia aerolata]
MQFATVGGLAFIVNASVTWFLMHSIFADSHGKAKIVAGVVATLFSWIMNRLWTFRSKRTDNKWREAVEFALVNAIGIAVEFGCVVFSYYVLGLTSPTASFISGTIVGTVLGTILRYFMYRFWVFGKNKGAQDLTREEEIAGFLEQATDVMTGRLPVIRKDQMKSTTEIRDED